MTDGSLNFDTKIDTDGIQKGIERIDKNISKALNKIDGKLISVQDELEKVGDLLKFDPKNVDLLAQRETLLAEKTTLVRNKLELLNAMQEKVSAALSNNANYEKQYQPLVEQSEKATDSLNELVHKKQEMDDELAKSNTSFAEYEGLNKSISLAEEKLEKLKNAKAETDEKLSKSDINLQSYKQLGNSITAANNELKSLRLEKKAFDIGAKDKNSNADAYNSLKKSIKSANEELKKLKLQKEITDQLLESNNISVNSYTKIGSDIDKLDLSLRKLKTQKSETDNKFKASGVTSNEYISLNQSITSTKSKLNDLNNAKRAVDKQFDGKQINATQFRDYQQEIIKTEQELKKAGNEVENFAKTSEISTKSLGKGLITAIKGVALGYTGKKLAEYFIGSNAEMEQYLTSFEVMLGSAEKAKGLMSNLTDFASKTPLELTDSVKSAQLLMNYGVAEDAVIGKMRQLGDLSLGNADKLNRVSLAYGQMLAKGKVTGEELRQMTEAGVPLLQALADSIGVSTAALGKMIEKGQVGIPELDKVIESLTTGSGKFAGMMAKQAGTMGGMLSTLKDNFEQFGRDVGEKAFGEIKNTIEEVLARIQEMSRDGSLEEIAEDVGNALNMLINVFVSVMKFAYEYKNAIMAGVAAMVAFKIAIEMTNAINIAVNAYKMLSTALKTSTVAQLALNVAQTANPIGLIVGAIAALVAGLAVYSSTCESTSKSIKSLNGEMVESKQAAADMVTNGEAEIKQLELKADVYEKLRKKFIETGEGEAELKKVAEELQQIMPEGINLINAQTGAYNELGSSIGDVISKMRAETLLNSHKKEYEDALAQAEEVKKTYDDAKKEYDDYWSIQENGNFAEQIWNVKTGWGEQKLSDDLNKANALYEANLDTQKKFEKEYSENYLNGLNSSTQKVANEIYTAVDGGWSARQKAVGKVVKEVGEETEEISESFKKQQEELKTSLDFGDIGEAEYYDAEEELLSQYTEDSKGAYKSYFLEIYNGRKSLNDKVLSTQEQTNKALLSDQESYNKKSVDTWEKGLDDIYKTAEKTFEDIENKKNSLADKLADSGDLFEVEDNDFFVNDLSEQTEQLKRYQEALENLKNAGASDDFMAEFTAMDVSDALDFSDTILSGDIDGYLKNFEAKQALSKSIADEFYADEVEDVQANFTDKIAEQMAEMPTIAGQLGQDTAAEFVNGIKLKMSEINELSAKMQAAVSSEMSKVSATAIVAANQTASGGVNTPSKERILQPVQLTLDGKTISEIVIEYANDKAYGSGKDVF